MPYLQDDFEREVAFEECTGSDTSVGWCLAQKRLQPVTFTERSSCWAVLTLLFHNCCAISFKLNPLSLSLFYP